LPSASIVCWRGLEDVEQPLVGSHLELLAAISCRRRRRFYGESLDARRQRNRPAATRPPVRFTVSTISFTGLVEQPVIRNAFRRIGFFSSCLLVDFGDDAGAERLRPPSRNREAQTLVHPIGVISAISIDTLSPGIHHLRPRRQRHHSRSRPSCEK